MTAPGSPTGGDPAGVRPRPPARSIAVLVARFAYLGLFVGPALTLAFLEGQGIATGLVVVLAGVVAGVLGAARFVELRGLRVPAALAAVTVPVLLAPGGLLSVLLAAASGFGVLAWITTITDAPMGPGRRRVGLSIPLLGLLTALAVAFAAPGLSAGPAFSALLVVLAVFVAALGLLGGPGPEASEVRDFEDAGPSPSP